MRTGAGASMIAGVTWHRRESAAAAGVCALAIVALPAPALAGTVGAAAGDASPSGLGVMTVSYVADPREKNELTVVIAGADLVVRDAAGVTVGAGCSRPDAADATLARCPLAKDFDIDIDARLGDGADRAALRLRPADEARIQGGPGDDVLRGGEQSDVFVSDRAADGNDTFRGGDGRDEISYERRSASVTADPDGRRDDGERGERDLIARDVETITGGRGRDRLSAGEGGGGLAGGGGDDVLSGGGAGDSMAGGAGDDRLFGRGAADELSGDGGDDLVVGGSGPDSLSGDDGDDTLRAEDRSYDLLVCSAGRDRAFADRRDMALSGCERVMRDGPAAAVAMAEDGAGDDGFLDFTRTVDRGFGNEPQVAFDVGCPVDVGHRCSGRLELTHRGQIVGREQLRVARGDRDLFDIEVTSAFAALVAQAGSPVPVTLIVISRDERNRRHANRLTYRVAPGTG